MAMQALAAHQLPGGVVLPVSTWMLGVSVFAPEVSVPEESDRAGTVSATIAWDEVRDACMVGPGRKAINVRPAAANSIATIVSFLIA